MVHSELWSPRVYNSGRAEGEPDSVVTVRRDISGESAYFGSRYYFIPINPLQVFGQACILNLMEQTKKTSFVAGAAILAFAGVLCKIIGVFIRIWAYDIIGEAGMVYYEVVFPPDAFSGGL